MALVKMSIEPPSEKAFMKFAKQFCRSNRIPYGKPMVEYFREHPEEDLPDTEPPEDKLK